MRDYNYTLFLLFGLTREVISAFSCAGCFFFLSLALWNFFSFPVHQIASLISCSHLRPLQIINTLLPPFYQKHRCTYNKLYLLPTPFLDGSSVHLQTLYKGVSNLHRRKPSIPPSSPISSSKTNPLLRSRSPEAASTDHTESLYVSRPCRAPHLSPAIFIPSAFEPRYTVRSQNNTSSHIYLH